ncbi:MAG TPA: elongation factor EF-2, partial [Nanoarchaeota archaeon]|nr:elongation factor EF-2 [Nanoarchaeota archaeon]
YKDKWLVRVEDGSVAFGSALRKWAISVPFMKRSGVTFKDIIELCSQDRDEELAKKAPLHVVILDMVIKHLPSPVEAQKYRIEKIWTGDIESEVGKDLVSCNTKGKLAGIITKVVYDPHAGMVCTARIFSGTLKAGEDIYLVNSDRIQKVQQVTTFIADKRIPVDYAVAGNVVGITGLTEAFIGETICSPEARIEPFEAIKHIFEPVVTKSIEPKNPRDLPKLINILKILSREDPTLKVEINHETGEILISGLGELHLEAKVENKIKEKGIEINVSPPIVVYRETVKNKSPIVEGKSPNKHNKFYITVEPMPKEIYNAIVEGKIKEGEVKGKKDLDLRKQLIELGMNKEDAKAVVLIHNASMFLDCTKGVQYLNEAMELVKQGFKNAIDAGPLAKEPVSGIIVKLVDAELHEDAVHRGPAQVIPAVRYAIHQAMLKSDATLLEPKQILRLDVPQEYIGNVTAEINNRRGEIINIEQQEASAIITAKIPVAELFGFESALKSATGGKGFQSLIDVVFEPIPKDLRDETILKIRERKGLPKEIPEPEV